MLGWSLWGTHNLIGGGGRVHGGDTRPKCVRAYVKGSLGILLYLVKDYMSCDCECEVM
jgi:hypothetical protein